MSNRPTPEEVRISIVPKSDQLNADDLIAGPITVTIEGVKRGDREQPIIVDISGYRPYKPCKSMRRVLVAMFSDDSKAWVGQQMTLFCDPEVKWAGVKVGGIRISHLSGLDKPKTFLITQTRGKRTEVTIQPIAPSPDVQPEIEQATQDIEAAPTLEALKAVGFVLKSKPKAVQDAVRKLYGAKQKQLSKQTPPEQPQPQLSEYLVLVSNLASAEECAEFRELILAGCPEENRAAVEAALGEKETELKGGAS